MDAQIDEELHARILGPVVTGASDLRPGDVHYPRTIVDLERIRPTSPKIAKARPATGRRKASPPRVRSSARHIGPTTCRKMVQDWRWMPPPVRQ